jgi:hypothetical protein
LANDSYLELGEVLSLEERDETGHKVSINDLLNGGIPLLREEPAESDSAKDYTVVARIEDESD